MGRLFAPNSASSHRSVGWHDGVTRSVLLLCTSFILGSTNPAKAQCTASDVLQNQLRRNKIPSPVTPQVQVRSAADVPVWKTITVGSFSDLPALRNALDAVGCGIGESTWEILARPAFTLSATKADVELVTVSATELGFRTETASMGQIYARARQLGFELAAAEIAPQLRLQYLDQPIGEFLIIGMEPIKTWKGEPVILTVANGGAGLILIGQDGRADAEIFVESRFLFVRPNKAAPSEAALVVSGFCPHSDLIDFGDDQLGCARYNPGGADVEISSGRGGSDRSARIRAGRSRGRTSRSLP